MSTPIVMSEQVNAACNRITSAANVSYASAAREVVHAYQAMLDDYNTCREELEAKTRETDAIEKMYRVEQGTTDRLKAELSTQKTVSDQLAAQRDSAINDAERWRQQAETQGQRLREQVEDQAVVVDKWINKFTTLSDSLRQLLSCMSIHVGPGVDPLPVLSEAIQKHAPWSADGCCPGEKDLRDALGSMARSADENHHKLSTRIAELEADRIPFAEAFAKPLRERIVQLEAALNAEQGDLDHTLELGRVCGALRVKDWRNAGEAAYQLDKSNQELRDAIADRLDEVAVKSGQISELEKSLDFTRKLALQPTKCCCTKGDLP